MPRLISWVIAVAGPRRVCDLRQTPGSCGDSSRHSVRSLQTLTKSMGILWHLGAGRWLSALEQFLAMGHPILQSHVVAAGGSSMFSIALEGDPSPLRTRRSLSSQAGNAMHVNSIGAVLASVLILVPGLVVDLAATSATVPCSDVASASGSLPASHFTAALKRARAAEANVDEPCAKRRSARKVSVHLSSQTSADRTLPTASASRGTG
jgi:hypothetical protein